MQCRTVLRVSGILAGDEGVPPFHLLGQCATHRSIESKHTNDTIGLVALPLQLALQLNDDEVAADNCQWALGGLGREVVWVQREVDPHRKGG